MKIRTKKSESEFDKEVDAILRRLSDVDPATDEYQKLCESLNRIADIRDRMNRKKKSVSPDTMALIVANLAGIIIVLGYEQGHIIASKAFSMISKLRF